MQIKSTGLEKNNRIKDIQITKVQPGSIKIEYIITFEQQENSKVDANLLQNELKKGNTDLLPVYVSEITLIGISQNQYDNLIDNLLKNKTEEITGYLSEIKATFSDVKSTIEVNVS
jgi:hypothetical protein